MKIHDVKIIELPKIIDERGNLSFIESPHQIPFSIKRTYWIYDVPGGEKREGHAYRTQQECIIALSGSFDVIVDDGISIDKILLNRSYYAIYLPPGIWRSFQNFSTNSLCLVLADAPYNEEENIRDYNEYKKIKDGENSF